MYNYTCMSELYSTYRIMTPQCMLHSILLISLQGQVPHPCITGVDSRLPFCSPDLPLSSMLIVYDRTFSTASVQCDDDAEQPWLRESQQVRMPQVIPPQSTRRKRRRKPMSKKKQRRKSKRKSRHHLSRKHKQPKQSKQVHVYTCFNER